MIPAPFEYQAAASAGQAVELLARYGDEAKLLAGGHSLLPMMKLRLAAPAVLIDISRVAELAGVRADGTELVIGAATCHADLAASELIRSRTPLLAHAAGQVGDPQIRHRGTIGGSLAHADPAADLPMALLALGGSVEVLGPGGARQVPIDGFCTGFFETSLEPDELITAIRVPGQAGSGWGYQKFVRRANDWAIVGVAAAGRRIALANMGPVPLRARAAEQALAEGASPAQAAALAADGTSPGADMHADRGYREHLTRVLTRRALEQSVDRA
jgi:carbon-monoxide dehydrogenase medium subunit